MESKRQTTRQSDRAEDQIRRRSFGWPDRVGWRYLFFPSTVANHAPRSLSALQIDRISRRWLPQRVRESYCICALSFSVSSLRTPFLPVSLAGVCRSPARRITVSGRARLDPLRSSARRPELTLLYGVTPTPFRPPLPVSTGSQDFLAMPLALGGCSR